MLGRFIEWLKQRTCPHRWVVLHRGRLYTLRRCQYCGRELWMKN